MVARPAPGYNRGMRYSKSALLLFGAGLVLGLAVVSANLPALARIASLAMAAGIVLLPVAIVADLRRTRPLPAKRGKSTVAKRRGAPARRRTQRRRAK